MRKHIRSRRKTQTQRKKRERGLCKNIGSTQLEVNILNQRIQQVRRRNRELTRKNK